MPKDIDAASVAATTGVRTGVNYLFGAKLNNIAKGKPVPKKINVVTKISSATLIEPSEGENSLGGATATRTLMMTDIKTSQRTIFSQRTPNLTHQFKTRLNTDAIAIRPCAYVTEDDSTSEIIRIQP